MRICVLSETDQVETRVAVTPDTVKKYKSLGADVFIQSGAGATSGIPDAEFEAAGATITEGAAEAVRDADVVLAVRRPDPQSLNGVKPGAVVVAIMDPYGQDVALKGLAEAGVATFAMELMPRITRAQVMDVLSSQANLAGYKALIDAMAEYSRALPMMMTAAGTVTPAKVFIVGAGVAGLQAIATARRMGAVVSATDVRPAAKERSRAWAASSSASVCPEHTDSEGGVELYER